MKEKKYEAYENAVRQVWADGQVSLDEADMIEALRKSFNISLEEHAEIESKIRRELDPKAAAKNSQDQKSNSTTAGTSGQGEIMKATSDSSGSIGDLSSDDLTKDLDNLTKSIDKVSQDQEPPEPTPSEETPEPTPVPEPKETSVDTSSRLEELSLKMKLGPQKSDDEKENEHKPHSTLSLSTSSSMFADMQSRLLGDQSNTDRPSTSDDLLERLKQNYEIEHRGVEKEIPSPDNLDDIDEPVEEDEHGKPEVPSPQEPAEPDEDARTKATPGAAELSDGDSETVAEYIDAGKMAFRNKDFELALQYYKAGLSIDPNNREIKFFMKKVLTAMKSGEDLKVAQPVIPNKPMKKKKKMKKKVTKEDDDELESWDSQAKKIEKTSLEPDLTIDEEEETLSVGKSMKDDLLMETSGGSASCKSCGGTGKCNWCKGSMNCYWCNGSGKCTKCNGTKELNGKPCEFCSEQGTCASCQGTGKCTWCKGTGKCSTCSM